MTQGGSWSNGLVAQLTVRGELQKRLKLSPAMVHDVVILLVEDPPRVLAADRLDVPNRLSPILWVRRRFDVVLSIEAVSQNDHPFTARITFPFEAEDSQLLIQLHERLLASRLRTQLSLDDLGEAVRDALEPTLRRFMRSRASEELRFNQPRDGLADAVRSELSRFCSSHGLRCLDRNLRCAFLSPSFDRARSQALFKKERLREEEFNELVYIARTKSRLINAKTVRDFAEDLNLGEWFQEYLLECSVQDDAVLPPSARYLQRRSPGTFDHLRDDMEAAHEISLLAACGTQVLEYHPVRHTWAVRFDDRSLGGFRSVSLEDDAEPRVLWVGARDGVWRVPFDDRTAPATSYPLPMDAIERRGVNSIAVVGHRLYACHSRIGLLCWDLEDPSSGRVCLQRICANRSPKARGVRHLGDGVVSFIAGPSVFLLDTKTEELTEHWTGHNASLCDYVVRDDRIHAITSQGGLMLWEHGTKRPLSVQKLGVGGRPASLRIVDFLGRPYYVVASAIECCPMVPLDSPSIRIHRFRAPGQEILQADACANWLYGIAEHGSTLVVWNLLDPSGAPSSIEDVRKRYGHGVKDLVVLEQKPPLEVIDA